MIIDRSIVKQIEYHLYNHEADIESYSELVDSIANCSSYELDPTGIRSTGGSHDKVGELAIRIEHKGEKLKKWIDVVNKTKAHFANTSYLELIDMVYNKRYSSMKIQDLLYISESTFFYWKENVILYAALKASEYGLISV